MVGLKRLAGAQRAVTRTLLENGEAVWQKILARTLKGDRAQRGGPAEDSHALVVYNLCWGFPATPRSRSRLPRESRVVISLSMATAKYLCSDVYIVKQAAATDLVMA